MTDIPKRGTKIYSYEDIGIEEALFRELKARGLTIAAAESCTGGLLSKYLTDTSGASEVFIGSIIAYNNRIKTDILRVKEDTLKEYGAVSPETAKEMAECIRKHLRADIGISITGIAGPTGGSEAKPVGTVWFGLSTSSGTITESKRFIFGRNIVRDRAAKHAMMMVLNLLR